MLPSQDQVAAIVRSLGDSQGPASGAPLTREPLSLAGPEEPSSCAPSHPGEAPVSFALVPASEVRIQMSLLPGLTPLL